jgi:hypothetical protein
VKADRALTIIRHLGMMLVGFAGIIHQEFFSEEARPWLLGVYTAMLGLPGGLALIQLRNAGGGSTTTEQSPSSPSSSLQSGSQPSSPNASGGSGP